MSAEKKFYVEQITELASECGDIALLDLIYKLLVKSI